MVDKGLLDYDFITFIGDIKNNLLVTKSDVNKHFIEFMNSQVLSNIIKMPTRFKTPHQGALYLMSLSQQINIATLCPFHTERRLKYDRVVAQKMQKSPWNVTIFMTLATITKQPTTIGNRRTTITMTWKSHSPFSQLVVEKAPHDCKVSK